MTLLVDIGQDTQPFLDGPIVRACDVELVRASSTANTSRGQPAREDGNAPQGIPARAQERTGQRRRHAQEIGGTQFVWLAKNETGA